MSNINPYDNSYKSIDFNEQIYKIIPEVYFESKFKIKSYMMNKSFHELLEFTEDVSLYYNILFNKLVNRKMLSD